MARGSGFWQAIETTKDTLGINNCLSIDEWNDDPARTLEEVIAFVDEVEATLVRRYELGLDEGN